MLSNARHMKCKSYTLVNKPIVQNITLAENDDSYTTLKLVIILYLLTSTVKTQEHTMLMLVGIFIEDITVVILHVARDTFIF